MNEDNVERIRGEVLALPVAGQNLRNGTLGDQLQPCTPTILVFLRHFG